MSVFSPTAHMVFMNHYTAPEPTSVLTNVDALLHRWETTPALRKGTSATELRAAMEPSMVTDLEGLKALKPGTLLLSTVTGKPWRVSEHADELVEGIDVEHTLYKDLLDNECPAVILTVPAVKETR